MKTILATATLALTLTITAAFGQPYIVDLTTPHTNGAAIFYGDPLQTCFTIANSNATWLAQQTTNAVGYATGVSNALETQIVTLQTNAIFTNIISAPFLKLTPYTVASNTATTFTNGAGLMAADTNWLYVSIGSNSWARIALTNVW